MSKFVRNLTVQQGLIISGTDDVIGAGDLPASGVTAGTYGDASHTLTVTVDVAGRITAIATNAISAGMTNPMTTLGDIIYESATPAPARLAGNTSTTRKFLRQVGTGTISAAPAWDTLVVGDLPPYPGQIVGYNFVATDESTTSTTYVDLATVDSVTFTLGATQDLLVEYLSSAYNTVTNGVFFSEMFLDGVAQTSSEVAQGEPVASTFVAHIMSFKMAGVAAGSHTIKVQHKTQTSTTSHWKTRALKVSILA